MRIAEEWRKIGFMALTCDRILDAKTHARCGAPSVTQMNVTMRDRIFVMDLCGRCSKEEEGELIRAGARAEGANVDYKLRRAYIAKSGASFTAEEARPWLVERGLAKPKGRLSEEQRKLYADAH